MEWSREKDTILAKEVLYSEPFQYKERTAQNVQAWQDVIAKVKTNYPKKFERLTQRGAKEHPFESAPEKSQEKEYGRAEGKWHKSRGVRVR